jgi:V/A-type H+-transporting ATPase subunit C
MAGNGASGYAAINARVRVMYSTLLTSQEMNGLYEAPDFTTLIGLLRQTAYQPYLEKAKDKDLTPRRAVFLLRTRMVDAFSSIIPMLPETSRPLLTHFFRDYELSNVKAVLRGIVNDAPWDKVRFVLFPLGSKSVVPAQEMVEAGNVTAAVEMLAGTPYYETLSFALKRYTSEGSLFPLEVALDLNYWRELWRFMNRLPAQDRKEAQHILGTLLDMNNLMWAIRYRVYHNLSEEELINYTLPFGYKVRDEDIRSIAAGADIPQVVKHIYPDLEDVDTLLDQPRQGLPEFELRLQRRIARQCQVEFVGNPFHIGIPLAYLVLNELEIQDLTVLIEAKSKQTPFDSFKSHLLMETASKNVN